MAYIKMMYFIYISRVRFINFTVKCQIKCFKTRKTIFAYLLTPRQTNTLDPYLMLECKASSADKSTNNQFTLQHIFGGVVRYLVVHIQCSKLVKGLECAVLSMVLCTIKKP